MNALNKQSQEIFSLLIDKARKSGENYLKLDSDNGFMPLHVEKIWTLQPGELWSLGHYGVMNGDAMADPQMEFIVSPSNFVYPVSYKNDYVACYSQAVFFKDDRILNYCFQTYKSLRIFSHLWLNNIREQQDL